MLSRPLGLLLFALPACAADPLYQPQATPTPQGACEDADTLWDVGLSRCVPPACGAGPYAEPPPGVGGLIHVDPAWSGGSNGSVTNPFSELPPALAAAGPGDTILLAAGSYAIEQPLTVVVADLHILGRCAALTELDAAGTALSAGQAGGARLEGVTVRGPGGVTPDLPLISCFNATGLQLVDVDLLDAAWDGVSLFQCGRVLLSGLRIDGAARAGLYSTYSSRVTIDATEITHTRPAQDGSGGDGAWIGQGDTPTLVSSVLADNAGAGLVLVESQDATLAGLELRDNGGPGARLLRSGNVWLRDSAARGNTGYGVELGFTTGGILDCDVSETRPLADGTGGQGIYVTNAQGVEIAGNTVQGNREVGIGFVLSTGVIHDNTVTGTRPDDLGQGGRGIELSVVNEATVEDNLVVDMPEAGITLLDGSATIRGNTVEDIGVVGWPGSPYNWGHGIHVQNVGAAQIIGNTVRGAHHAGISLLTGSGPEVRGNTVVDTHSGSPPDKFADGLQVIGVGGLLQLQGNTLLDNDRAGLLADGSAVEILGGSIRGSWVSAISQNGASVSLDGTDVRDNTSDEVLVHGPRIHRVHADPMTPLVAVDLGER